MRSHSSNPDDAPSLPERIGSLVLLDELQRGGMGAVYVARRGPPGPLSKLVAVKRVHRNLLSDPVFRDTFVDEARVALRIRHANCVSTEEVIVHEGELLLVMELLEGVTASQLAGYARRREQRVPIPIALGIIEGALRGLHAAHETTDENGQHVGLVHRDVSPQNVFVCLDGTPKLLDFGVVKAAGRVAQTAEGIVKGKFPYMAPEQLRRGQLDRRTDLYAMGVVLWELLTGRRLVATNDPAACMGEVLTRVAPLPSVFRHETPAWVDELCRSLLVKRRDDRPESAESVAEIMRALAGPGELAGPPAIAAYVRELAGSVLEERRATNRALATLDPPPSPADPVSTTGGLEATVHAPLVAPGSDSLSRVVAAGVFAGVALLAISLFRDPGATETRHAQAGPLADAATGPATQAGSNDAAASAPAPAATVPRTTPEPAASGAIPAAPAAATAPARTTKSMARTAPLVSPGASVAPRTSAPPVKPGRPADCAKNPFHVVNGFDQLRPECAAP
jgi:eukaryotic-like serine/threonine-protein kinase